MWPVLKEMHKLLVECALESVQRAKSGLGEAPLGTSAEGKGSRAHSMLSSHLQGGGRKNSITGVTKRHLGALQLLELELRTSGLLSLGDSVKLHSMLSRHLQSGSRKNSITGVTKRHLASASRALSEECAHASMNLMPVLLPISCAWMLQKSIAEGFCAGVRSSFLAGQSSGGDEVCMPKQATEPERRRPRGRSGTGACGSGSGHRQGHCTAETWADAWCDLAEERA